MERHQEFNNKSEYFVFRLHSLFEEAFKYGCHRLDELYQDFLGIYFLKIMSDRFGDSYEELITLGSNSTYGSQSEFILKIPRECRWMAIKENSHNQLIGDFLDNTIERLLEINQCLSKILPHNYSREEWNKKVLGKVIDLIDIVENDEYEKNLAILNGFEKVCCEHLYRYYYKELYKPVYLNQLLFQLLNIHKGKIYNPQQRRGELLIDALSYFKTNNVSTEGISFIAQDKNVVSWAISQLKFLILSIDAYIELDLSDPDYVLSAKFDYIIFDTTNFDFECNRIERLVNALSTNGKAALYATNKLLSDIQTNTLHEIIMNEDLLDSVISLPPNKLDKYTKIPVYLVILDKNKKAPGLVKFIDATHLGHSITDSEVNLTNEEIRELIDIYQNPQKNVEVDHVCSCVKSIKTIVENDIKLIPEFYIDTQK